MGVVHFTIYFRLIFTNKILRAKIAARTVTHSFRLAFDPPAKHMEAGQIL